MTSGATKIKGLVLAGGRSVRMGTDKGLIQWHAKEQRYHIADLLSSCCDEVFISCRKDQLTEIGNEYRALPDRYENAGPLGAILTALASDEHCAWLILACDLPLMDEATLQQLIAARNTEFIATGFVSPYDGLPEPLISVWEPASRKAVQDFFEEGIKCPRKVLIRNEDSVQLISADNPDALLNANTPEDAEKVKSILANTI